MTETTTPRVPLPVHRDHRRGYADHRYVYAVVSRRSRGVSIGLNLNPDKICNFDCVYCQVDRHTPPTIRDVEVAVLLEELETVLDDVASGALFEQERFRATPPALRRLNDVAFSGDGEPTTSPEFLEIVQGVIAAKRQRGLQDVKIVVITNATRFHVPQVQQAFALLDLNQGEIWAKLEAGTSDYYQAIERTTVPFQRVLDNIQDAARQRPIVIQSMFLKMHGEPPSPAELAAFCERLSQIVRSGGRIKLVQVYTVARQPAESWVSALTNDEVDAIVRLVQESTGLAAEPFYGG